MANSQIDGFRENHILARLTDRAIDRLRPHLEAVELASGTVLHEPQQVQEFAYFPTSCIVALINFTADGDSAKVAMTGRDGVVGIAQLLNGNTSPVHSMVQTAGRAWRIKTEPFRREYFRASALMRQCHYYTQLLMAHHAQLVVCNRHHRLEQQLCGWLLFSLDRLPSNRVDSTQELVASLLGVRRQGVSEAAARLESDGLIERRRGSILVINRARLEQRACECYQAVKREQEHLFGPQSAHPEGEDVSLSFATYPGELRRQTDGIELALASGGLAWWDVTSPDRSNSTIRGRGCMELLGYHEDSFTLTLSDWVRRVHPEDVAVRLSAHHAHYGGVTPTYASEYRVMHKDGHWVWIESRGKVVQRNSDGTPLRMVGTLIDITVRKQTEMAIQRLVCTDFLTGAATRREFFDVAEREFARAARYELPMSLMALDLDHFKGINDRFGHQVGDIVLKTFVETVKTFLREFDTFGRTGGEEFCILLPQTDLAGAGALAHRILEGVRAAPIPVSGQMIEYSVSIGVAEMTRQTPSLDALMHTADKVLYSAKAKGRARVVVYG